MVNGLTKAKRALFLRHLREKGHVVAACRAAKVARSSMYAARNADPEFAAEWERAELESADLIEAEMWRRGVEGYEKPYFYKGEQVATVRHYSDRMLERLAKARRPERFQENYKAKVDVDLGLNVAKFTREQLEAIAAQGLPSAAGKEKKPDGE